MTLHGTNTRDRQEIPKRQSVVGGFFCVLLVTMTSYDNVSEDNYYILT